MNLEDQEQLQTVEDTSAAGSRRSHPVRWLLLLVILPMLLTGLAVHLATRRPHVPVDPPGPAPDHVVAPTPAVKPPDAPVRPRLRVRVVDQNAKPLPGVLLELVSHPEEDDHAVLTAGTTGLDGRAELSAPPGRHGLRAFSSTHFGALEIVDIPGNDEFVVRLSPGVDFSLLVTDEEGLPQEGASVRETWLDTGRVVLTGADGVAPLGARHPQWCRVAVAKDGENVLVLHRVCRVEGQAIDAATGTPIAKALLDFELDTKRFLLEGRSERAVTDREGHFVAEKLRRGRYRVRVRGTKLEVDVEITRDEQDLGPVRFEVR